jgi:signal transduction histidine kinase
VRAGVVGGDMNSGSSLLLRSVAEELKLPLLQIGRDAELQDMASTGANIDLTRIQNNADMALLLIDSYLLGLELNEAQTELLLEPVSLTGTLNDAAHTLSKFARQYNTKFELVSSGKFGLVMAHAIALRAALLSLGYALISVPQLDKSNHRIVLGVHQSGHGLVAGVYGDFDAIAHTHLKQARSLYGRARQPFRMLSSGSAAGVFVADTIFQAMHTKLNVSHHHKNIGLAATLQPSKQLLLV